MVTEEDVFDGVHEELERQGALLEHTLGEDKSVLVLQRRISFANPVPEHCLELARFVQRPSEKNAVRNTGVEDATKGDVEFEMEGSGIATAAMENFDHFAVLEDLAERVGTDLLEDFRAAMDVEDDLKRRSIV